MTTQEQRSAQPVPFSRVIRVLVRAIALVVAPAPGLYLLYCGLIVLTGLLPVAQVWLLKVLIDRLARHGDPIFPAALYAVSLVAGSLLGPPQQSLMAWLEDRAVATVDRLLMDAGARLVDLTRVERPDFQEEVRLAQSSASWLPRITTVLQRGAGSAITLIGLLLLLGRLQPILPLLLLALAMPRVRAERQLRHEVFRAMAKHSAAAREMDYVLHLAVDPGSAKEVRVFCLGDYLSKRFGHFQRIALTEVGRIRWRTLRTTALFALLHALTLAGGFWYVAVQAGVGRLSLGDVALYLGAIVQTETQLSSMTIAYSFLIEASLGLGALFSLVDSARPGVAVSTLASARRCSPAFDQGITLREVGFAYPGSARPVLDGVSADVPVGKITALVGENGAGKSTLVKLLTRMYDPDEGEIRLDGVSLAAYDLDSLRERVAVVYQDFARFALTLGENVAVGAVRSDEIATLRESGSGSATGVAEQVRAAAGWSGANDVAAQLEQGYDTPLTRRFEGGVELSGGEWQKVALARGFIRDAALVILDEPTAALDAAAEHALFERFRALVAGRTALLISHRFSTVRLADQILVLEGGKVVEAGTHDDLMTLQGRYARLYTLQASKYRG